MNAPGWYRILFRIYNWLRYSLLLLGFAALLRFSAPQLNLQTQVGVITSTRHFDFISWTLEALGGKLVDHSSRPQHFLTDDTQSQIVRDYFVMMDETLRLESEIEAIYSDPNISDPEAEIITLLAEVDALRAEMARYQPLAESVLQEQTVVILNEFGFGVLGEMVPPVSFHLSPLPRFLIISPRDRIEQIHATSIQPGLNAAEQAAIETQIDAALDVSSLVVPIGGLGIYPTMIYETSSLSYITETVAHEWGHNWLTLRPLGISYDSSPELRTINETTANLFGKEIGRVLLTRFYPELAPLPAAPTPTLAPDVTPTPTPTPDPGQFDFRVEMRITRLEVDRLLGEGQIEAAEAYMEARREVFAAQGFRLRKLNQAYFAFHGAYADTPGAAGEDPVGPAVTKLREQSGSLREFMRTIAWVTSFEELQKILEDGV